MTISAATQTLADFIAHGVSPINKEHISFEHPRVQHESVPALNLYCYRVQASSWNHLFHSQNCSGNSPSLLLKSPMFAQQQMCQWFDLTFLVSVSSHTALAEQHLLSEVLTMFLGYRFLPEEFLSPLLRGQGQLPMTISTEPISDTLLLWQVLRTPLRLALHVTITIPFGQYLCRES